MGRVAPAPLEFSAISLEIAKQPGQVKYRARKAAPVCLMAPVDGGYEKVRPVPLAVSTLKVMSMKPAPGQRKPPATLGNSISEIDS